MFRRRASRRKSWLVKWRGGGIGNPFAAIGRAIGGVGREVGKTARVGLRQGGKTARGVASVGGKVAVKGLDTAESVGTSAIEHGAIQAAASFFGGDESAGGVPTDDTGDFDMPADTDGITDSPYFIPAVAGLALLGIGVVMSRKGKRA
jgi:hypothetical protein